MATTTTRATTFTTTTQAATTTITTRNITAGPRLPDDMIDVLKVTAD